MRCTGVLIILCVIVGQTSAFFPWWRNDFVCSSTCTSRFCPFGYLEKGCPRCTCSRNPCKIDTCGVGFRCVTKPTECAVVYRCPHEYVCVSDNSTVCAETCENKVCPYGFKEKGCPRCECAENPCQANTCNTVFQICQTEATDCVTGNNCPHKHKCVLQKAPRRSNNPSRLKAFNAAGYSSLTDCEDTCPDKDCRYGFTTKGCPRCACAPDPCRISGCKSRYHMDRCLYKSCVDVKTTRCDSGKVCHAEPSVCKYRNRCPYVAKCRDTACEEFCPQKRCRYGFLMSGCPRCTCAPNPCLTTTCPSGHSCVTEPAKCRFLEHCHHVAVCKEDVCSSVCPNKECPFGFQLRGCPRCDCVLDPCMATRCPANQGCTTEPGRCEFGNNCPKVPVCKSVCEATTRQFCRHGFLSEGCPRSRCAPDPCRNADCPGRCESKPSKCEFSTGCPHVATCLPAEACESSCRINCQYGMLSEGCPRCKCAPDPCKNFSCLYGSCVATPAKCDFSSNCPHRASCVAPCQETCRKTCRFGFLSSGCPRCECAPNPCEQNPCTSGAECKTRPVSCMFITGCPHEAYCMRSRGNHRCLKPKHSGSQNCNKRVQRYYFDSRRRRCTRFIYRGCGGTINNFTTYWGCLMTCRLVF